MTPDLQAHLLGIFRAIKARIELINASVGHAATQGGENEAEIRRLLTSFLPPKYGVGTGRILGVDGKASRQVDIVLFDKERANYTLSGDSKLFLADHVYAAIEVKTTFTSGTNSSLAEALENVESVKSLKVAQRDWHERCVNQQTGAGEVRRYTPAPPLGVVFFFGAADVNQSRDMSRWFATLKAAIDNVDVALQPDLLFSLEHAAFFRHTDIDPANPTPEYSVALVNTADTKEPVRVGGVSKETKGIMDLCETELLHGLTPQHAVVKNASEKSQVVIVGGGESLTLDPMSYRLGRIGEDKFFLLDHFRAFLAFCYSLERLLLAKRLNKNWHATDYFGEYLMLASKHPDDFDAM